MENNDKIFDDKSRAEIPVDFGMPAEPGWKDTFKSKTVIFSVLAAVLAIGGIGWYFLGNGNGDAPVSNNVVLMIKGPDQLMAGNEAEYKITYRNGESADLINLSMEVFYPSGFKFKSSTPASTTSSGAVFNLPMVRGGQSGEVVLRGKLSGSTGEAKQMKAILHYKLSNFNSNFAVEQTISTSILPPNLTMDVNGPVDVVNGQDTTFTVTFTNVTPQEFDNLALQLAYPEGFTFAASSPPPSKNNNYWTLPKLASNSSASIDISGSFSGTDGEAKLVKADLGQVINNNFAPQLVSTATFKLIPSALAIILTADVKDNVELGETIDYQLDYSNQGRIGLNNLNLVVKLEGTALDLPRMTAQDAIVTGNTLTWKAATMPGLGVLSPSERGQIRFSVPVKETLNTNIKNQIVKASASITSDETPKATKATDVVLKLASNLDLIVRGDYISGAAPMQVGKTTLFGMTFMLTNQSNDLSNVKVVAALPLPPSAWKNVIVPDAEKNRLSYDPNSGKITWNIGDLAAFVGKYTPATTVTFRIEVLPTEVDRNKAMNLLSNVQATGNDTFTNLSLATENINIITTADIEDDVLTLRGETVE